MHAEATQLLIIYETDNQKVPSVIVLQGVSQVVCHHVVLSTYCRPVWWLCGTFVTGLS